MSDYRDHLARQITNLAQAIADALHASASGPDERARARLDDAIASASGLHIELLMRLTPGAILSLVGLERAELLSHALEARGRLSDEEELAAALAASRRLRRALARSTADRHAADARASA